MRAFGFFAIVLALALPTSARADDATHVVVADTSATAVLIWNATPVVAQIVTDRANDPVANERLERGALRAIATSLKVLVRAKTVTVRILYDKTGAVSPVYGDPTFAGVERYATITFAAARGRASASKWRGLRDTDALPPWVAFHVIGTLPPR